MWCVFLWLEDKCSLAPGSKLSLANVTVVDIRGPDNASSLLGGNSITLNLPRELGEAKILKDSRRHTQQGCSLLRQERKITSEEG